MKILEENRIMERIEKNIYYQTKISFSYYLIIFVFALLIGAFIPIVLINIINSFFYSITLGVLLSLFYLYRQFNYRLMSFEISNEGIIISFPLSFNKKKYVVNYDQIKQVFFYCGPFGLNYPAIFISFSHNSVILTKGFECRLPSNIEKILQMVSSHGVKTGISSNSIDYLGLKSKIPLINTDNPSKQ